jgi:GNAT superfamily N-acetyltransferase
MDYRLFKDERMHRDRILTDDVELIQLTELFVKNQQCFYHYIANYAAENEHEEPVAKPLRFHRIENTIDCLFSPHTKWSFYNAILDADLSRTIATHRRTDENLIIEQILSLASLYECPIRSSVNPAAIPTQQLLRRHGFVEMPTSSETYQYVDFYGEKNSLASPRVFADTEILELDDSTQSNCQMQKSEWGYVLSESFGFPHPEIHGPFYSNVWTRVKVGPERAVRMFVAVKNGRVVGGCHVSLACGVACLFNVTTLKSERGRGIGKALSLRAMAAVRESKYRYIVLQSSRMGLRIYKQLGFQPIPSYKTFVKLSTVAWYFRVVEVFLQIITIQQLQNCFELIRNPSKVYLFAGLIATVMLLLLLTKTFG